MHFLARNYRTRIGEIDLLFADKNKNCIVVIEVRGVQQDGYLPSRTLSPAKLRRVRRMALGLSRKFGKTVRVEFHEWVGAPPRRGIVWLWSVVWLRLGGRLKTPRLRLFNIGFD